MFDQPYYKDQVDHIKSANVYPIAIRIKHWDAPHLVQEINAFIRSQGLVTNVNKHNDYYEVVCLSISY